MNILVGKTFGLGNAVLSIPMIKALSRLGTVDVLIGSGPDDIGALDVMQCLYGMGIINSLFIDTATTGPIDVYDVAVMAIPFDGRWREGIHYRAKKTIDGRKRPGNVERLGFDMWEKHEVLYQMENARELGYDQPYDPDTSFLAWDHPSRYGDRTDYDLVYLGIGFKRDHGGFGRSKNWGLENFIKFMGEVASLRPKTRFVSTGNFWDAIEVGIPLIKRFRDGAFSFKETKLHKAFEILAPAGAYFGNDTGMMHVAASMGIPCHGIFLSEDLMRKNHPWGAGWTGNLLTDDPIKVAEKFVGFLESR